MKAQRKPTRSTKGIDQELAGKTLSVPVEFNAERHEYRVHGEIWPSVSGVIKRLNEFDELVAKGFVSRQVLEAAALFGQHVHAACHLDNLGQLDWEALDANLLPYVKAWRKWQIDFEAVIVGSEVIVVSERYMYCGTLDVIARIKGKLELIDIKATALIPRTAGPQTAAYAEAYGMADIRRRVVQLRGDGTYQSRRLGDFSQDWQNFVAGLTLHNWFDRS